MILYSTNIEMFVKVRILFSIRFFVQETLLKILTVALLKSKDQITLDVQCLSGL